MGSIVNKIHKEVKVVKTFQVIRTLIEGSKNFYKAGGKVVTVNPEKITYRTVKQMFGEEQRPLMFLPYDKKNFDLLTHAIIKMDDNYVFEILPENVRGNLGYMVEMRTKDLRLIKRITFTVTGDIVDCANYPVSGIPAFVGEYIAVLCEVMFKEKIDYDNGTAVIGIVNK